METIHDTSLAVYFADHDDVIECGACDPCYGDPADWPEWTDADRWTHIDPPDQVDPSPDDCRWAAGHLELPAPISGGAPADDEWSRRLEEMHQASRWLDQVEQMNYTSTATRPRPTPACR